MLVGGGGGGGRRARKVGEKMGVLTHFFLTFLAPANIAFCVHFSKRSFLASTKYLTVTQWILRRESKWT